MTMSIRTSRLAMLGAIGAMCALSGQATAQEGPQGLKTNNLGQTLTLGDAATVSQDIDINFDGIPDFVVKITSDQQLFQNEAPLDRGLPPGEFLEAGYILSLGVDNPVFSSVFFDLEEGVVGTDAETFDLGDVVGEGFFPGESRIPATSSAILYASVDSKGISSFGPFSEIGDTGFLGFASFDPETEDTNFGFLEITRGSLALGNLGFQQTANTGATITGVSAVPLPAPLGLLGFAIAGLFGLRRFGKS